MLWTAWMDGWRRVAAAPAIVVGVFALTFALALPLAVSMRDTLEPHMGRSLVATEQASGVDYDWWQEFTAQASGLGSTFTPTIVGFAATLDNISSVLDAQPEIAVVTAALALYLAGWTFVAGGILDRYARQRPTRAHGFFSASGVYFFRFLRLALVAGAVYWWLFAYVHRWLFAEQFADLARDISVERTAFLLRLLFYALFGALLMFANVVFDYAKVRLVVEDRRSAIGALAAAFRFVRRLPGRVLGLYALNALMFVGVLAAWAALAPGAGGTGWSLWAAIALGQLYVLVRLLLKLHFLASQTALFQASLAHASYTAAPLPVWPDSPAAEAIVASSPK